MTNAKAMTLATLFAIAGAAHGAAPSFCTGPQNAEAFPSKPVPVTETKCHLYQQYEATSPTTSYASSCGGYTVAFGPKGDLKHPADGLNVWVRWGDTAPTAASCKTSHVEGIAWGYQCNDKACASGKWEQIGTAQGDAGNWNTVSKICYNEIVFNAPPDSNYSTISVDARAYQQQGAAKTPKRVKVKIYAYRHTGQCISIPAKPQ